MPAFYRGFWKREVLEKYFGEVLENTLGLPPGHCCNAGLPSSLLYSVSPLSVHWVPGQSCTENHLSPMTVMLEECLCWQGAADGSGWWEVGAHLPLSTLLSLELKIISKIKFSNTFAFILWLAEVGCVLLQESNWTSL